MAFGLPFLAALIMTRLGWAAFYGVLLGLAVFLRFPNSLLIFGGILLVSLLVLVGVMWKNEEVRFHKTLPLVSCLVVFAFVPLGFPRTVSFELEKCLENRKLINQSALDLLEREPGTPVTVQALGLAEIPGCQGPGTSEYVVSTNKNEVQVTCLNFAHQIEGLGPAKSSYPREQSAETPPEKAAQPQP